MAKKKQAGLILSDAEMKRRYPDAGLAVDIAITPDNTLCLPSRILPINDHMNGGIFYGTVVELFGEESTGKTLLAMDFAAVAQSLGGLVIWADAEATFNMRWAIKNGLDPAKIYLLPNENVIEIISDWQADMIVTLRSRLTNNEPILLVVDSTAALETGDNMDAADTDSGEDMGRRSKKIYQMLRKRNKLYAKYGICVIYINQIRKKPVRTKYEDPDTTPGGMAMRFYASQRIGLYRGKKIMDSNEKKIGNKVYVRTKKSKVGIPRDSVQVDVYFKESPDLNAVGYDKYSGLPELLQELGVIKRKRGGLFYYKGKMIARGDAAFRKLLIENVELRKKLIKRSGINTVSITREKINSIDKNLYKVNAKKAKKESDSDSESSEEKA
jgi:recombination protein RecA